MLDLSFGLDFEASHEEDFFAALPARPAVYLIEPRASGAEPYLSRASDLRRSAERLLRAPDAVTKRLNLRDIAARIRYRLTGSRFEQSLVLYHHARAHFPRRFRDFLRLRPPALLKINLQNAYPRCYVTRRISADGGFYMGPFRSRHAAEYFADGFRDLFKVRRCQIKIRRDPTFPGCVYSEMKMCLAPCFAGCTPEEYEFEVTRAVEALASRGASLSAALEQERESASQTLDFERAAGLHKKLEKVSSALRLLPDLARRIEELDAVILQRAVEENTVAAFVVRGGFIAPPFPLHFADSGEPRSVESILREHLERAANAAPASAAANSANGEALLRARFGLRTVAEELPEHLSLLARWFYSKPRDGEIFFRETDWPYRRLIRACARVLAPSASGPDAATSPSS